MLKTINAQNNSKEKLASEAFNKGYFLSSSKKYEQLLLSDSNNLQYAFQLAESLRLLKNYKEASFYYSKVMQQDNDLKYLPAIFWNACMQKSMGNYAQSLMFYQSFINKYGKNNDYFYLKASNEIKALQEINQILKDTASILVKPLPSSINSAYSEFAPLKSAKKTLYFTSVKPPDDANEYEIYFPVPVYAKIYESTWNRSKWDEPIEVTAKINLPNTHNAGTSVLKSPRRIYFTRCTVDKTGKNNCKIFFSEFSNNEWQEAVELPKIINKPGYNSMQPCVVFVDKKEHILYFVSDRPNGYGENDIWYAIYKNGKYYEPSNLGSFINTPGNEMSPFYHSNTKTLYFSSDWHAGLGGYDIFKSYGNYNQWEKPRNLGVPFNSPADDYYLTINEVDSNGFFASNRVGSQLHPSETCCNDIYAFDWMQKIKPNLPPQDTVPQIVDVPTDIPVKIKQLLPISLYFHNDEPDPRSNSTTTKESYPETLKNYLSLIEKYKQGYAHGLIGEKRKEAAQDIEEFFNDFVRDGYDKLEEATTLLLQDLEMGNKVTLNVKAYCSPLSTNEYNKKLASRRISSLMNYFAEFQNGALKPYMDSASNTIGKLKIIEEPIGEEEADAGVSDNPNDRKESVYSRKAAMERRIAIILYSSIPSNRSLEFDTKEINIGQIPATKSTTVKFRYTNYANKTINILQIKTSCYCTSSEINKLSIAPKQQGELLFIFNPQGKKGIIEERIFLTIEGINEPIILTFKALIK